MNEWRNAPNKEWRVSKSQEGGKAKGMDMILMNCSIKGYNNFEGEMVRRKIHNYNRLHAK